MKTRLSENVSEIATNGFVVLTGTSGSKTGVAIRKIEYVYGQVNSVDKLKIVAFDAQGVVSTFPVPMVEADMDKMTLGVHELVPAILPDPESLEKAEHTCKLWPMDPGWYKKPGVSKDNLGTGGTPRNGRGMIHLNINRVRKKTRRNLRDCGDYRKQRQLMDKAEGKKAANSAITVAVCLSLLGGFGTGTLITLLRIIREEALALKLPVKIIVLAMVMGSIEPADREIAARNQAVFLHELNAILSGQYGFVGQDLQGQRLCDSVILISNANNHGEFDNLDRLIALAAQYIFYLFHTTLGQAIQEKAVDIEESWPKDDLGGLRWGSTIGLSKMHLDMPLAIRCIAHMSVNMFLQGLLASKKQPQAIKEADMMASEQALAETATKSLACERLHHLGHYGNADARQRAVTSFKQRSGNRRGFKRCCDLENASAYTLNVEMNQRLAPQMQREADRFALVTNKAIGNKVLMMLTGYEGIGKATQFLQALAEHMAGFAKANHKRLEVAQAKRKSINDMLGHAGDMLNALKGRFRLWRLLSFLTKREISRIYSVYTESAIRNRLEIKARLLLANEVYPAVHGYIAEQLAQVHQIVAHVGAGQKDVGREADRLRTFEPILTVPLGSELVTKEFISQKFEDVLAQESGSEAFLEKIFAEFIGRYQNLIAFSRRSWDQIKQTLLEYSTGVAHRHLCTLNVMDVLTESCTSTDELKERIAQCIGESSGRLRLAGEADEIIPTIKFIGVNDRSTGERIANMANEIDTTDGDWKPIEMKDPNTIVFVKQRCRVSVARMIVDADRRWKKPGSLAERAKLGSDPVLTSAPAPDCSEQSVHATVAMGLVSGALQLSEKGYESDGQNGDPILLGRTLKEVVSGLRDNYNGVVGLYESFVKGLARNHAEVEQKLNNYVQNCAGDDGSLAAQLGKAPFVRAQETADALMPYLRRMPRNGNENAVCQPELPESFASSA